jgi:VIT1/CCC1 family predicted Fe2+/Mn2+ transporter
LLWRDEEEQELVEILQSKGLAVEEAESAASRIMSDPEIALDVHVREELGIDPDDLGGSPILAAASSLAAFAAGAFVPLVPYILGLSGDASIISSAALAGFALAVVGGALGWLSGSGAIYGALRMLVVGLVAGAVTFGLGSLVGQQIG